MKIKVRPTHDKSIIWTLVNAYEKKNKKYQIILVTAVAISVAFLIGIFSFMLGKIQVDISRNVRENGSRVSNYLEEGTEDQKNLIERLSYIKYVGCEKQAGILMDNGKEIADCDVLDKNAYEKMMLPAFTDIHGNYPQKDNEIMMSLKILERLGVKNPEIGMELTLDFQWYGNESLNSGDQNFILSGYYQEYSNNISQASKAFLSREFLKKNNVSFFPLRILIDVDQKYLSGEQIEEKLYEDVSLTKSNQQFVCFDSPEYNAMGNALGGYGIAVSLAVLVLFSMFLFIYNLLFISMGQQLSQYGLLEIVGASHKQISGIVYLQSIRIGAKGSLIGAALGSAIVCGVLPQLLKKMYLGKIGSMENIKVFRIWILICAVLFVLLTLLVANSVLIRKLMKLEPLKVLRLAENGLGMELKKKVKKVNKDCGISNYKAKRRKGIMHENGASPGLMAWRNVVRSPRQFILAIFTLSLGCETALCAVMIVSGIDVMHLLKQNPDFKVEIAKEALNEYPYVALKTVLEDVNEETIYDRPVLSDELMIEIAQIAQIDEKQIHKTGGYFVGIDDVKESSYFTLPSGEQQKEREASAFKPIHRSEYKIWDGSRAGYYGIGIVQVLDENELQELEKYIENHNLSLDIDRFQNGEGTVIVHEHVLSQLTEQSAEETVGKPLFLYPVSVRYPQEDTYVEKGRLINCGYLDSTLKDFPQINKVWQGSDVLYFFVSKNATQQFDKFPKQIFEISFNVNSEKEPVIKAELKKWVINQNLEFSNGLLDKVNPFKIICNSDLIAEKMNYMEASRSVTGIICAGLLLIGIMNFINTITTNILMRKREFFLLRCIGMTGKQQKKILMMEGIYYWIIVMGGLVTVGTGIMYCLNIVMKKQINYFKFIYPASALVIMMILLGIICILIPQITYKRILKDDSTE